MELAEFLGACSRLNGHDIELIDAALLRRMHSPGDEIDAWMVTMAIEKSLRNQKLSRHAAQIASQTSSVIHAAAKRAGFPENNPCIVRIARAASEIVRGKVAGVEAEVEVKFLMREWEPVLSRMSK